MAAAWWYGWRQGLNRVAAVIGGLAPRFAQSVNPYWGWERPSGG
jgi:hypothetical protein